MTEDIGESLVGAYLRYVVRCEFILFNTFLPGEQGEIDVIGLRSSPRQVYFAEVTTHLGGMTYGGNLATIDKIQKKLERAKTFAGERFPDYDHYYEIWSPRVPVGQVTAAFSQMAEEFSAPGRLSFVINKAYGDRIQELIKIVRRNERATSDPAFRLLQVLARLKTTDGMQILN